VVTCRAKGIQNVSGTVQSQKRFGRCDKTSLSEDERGTVDAILRFNGDNEGFYLSELTHKVDPWTDVRKGLARGDKSDREITKASMRDYYSCLG
jgi:uncharacterized phage-associated protein